MSGLFRGALNLIQGESASNSSHPLIGTQVEVGSIRLRVDSLIAEGGFAVIENLLFDAAGRVKLCDFGSATTQIFAPDETWNMARRTQLEEEMQRHTTPMYRAPEILDTYQNYVVGPQQDIWALGCVLFYLCYHVHPFEDSAKLRILNVAYTVPSGCEECRDILPIIGGFAVVFAAYDSKNKWYALKRQLTKDRESMDAVLLEIRILKELSGHPSILEFVAAAQMKIPSGGVEFMLLTELCSGGSVADMMKTVRLKPEQAVKIFYAAARAVCHMHDRRVPITHRDIKIENLLFDAAGRVKLCDFGSATTQIFAPDETWNMARRTQLEEEMQRHTTPMYRAPAILDTYQNYVVGPQQDIWALGCVLFYLCYHVHPFEDSAKLRILNVAYTVPSGCEECRDILPIIESCLKADPLMRPGAKDLVERTEALAVALDIDLSKPVSNVDTGLLRRSQGQRPVAGGSSHVPPPRPPPPRSSVVSEEVTEQASAMLGALKGQGLSLLKNLKDKSTAVVQKVQAKLATQEVTWITSRLCIVPVARSAQEQVDEDEWNARVQATGKPYVVYNLSGRPLHGNYPIEQIPCVLRNVRPQVPPPIENILKVCSSIVTALRNRRGSCVVLYGAEIHCVMVSVALLVYCKLIGDANDAYDFVANKRRTAQRFAPSQIRSLDLIKNLTSSASVVLLPMNRPMSLRSISLSTLPILAGIRSGLRLVIEIFAGSNKVWDSVGCKRPLTVSKSLSSELDVGDVPLDGQITMLVSYSRSDPVDPATKKFMFSVVFHTSVAKELMKFSRSDLDISIVEENNIPPDFR
ncbi:kinase domain protein [Ancylostoma caninum]|uniref:Kinase domain protein n=1 Tax=Ancylostoma caninum TaxID=29170 RepID=A0A368GLS3_ANCCA|nr:kinase domain protein [Ancylostoma caninum]